jgi:uncharacterized paraquat-inducible protein A
MANARLSSEHPATAEAQAAGSLAPCGDCGTRIPRGSNGCPICGRNIAAERRLGVVLAFLLGAAALLLLAYAFVWLVRR